MPAYFQLNLSVSHDFDFASTGKLHTQHAVINVLDRSYELRDGSGIGVGAPQWGPRRGVYLTVSKDFRRDLAAAGRHVCFQGGLPAVRRLRPLCPLLHRRCAEKSPWVAGSMLVRRSPLPDPAILLAGHFTVVSH